ncbi:MAG: molecular chaperone HtpG [Rhodospirillaceae bacterium]|nr:molecular chaperone HtpG [Rhodospirillaceae bacterium]
MQQEEEKHGFQAEVGRLLDIVTHSLYTDRSIFLRELISNASDACDRLRYLALTQPGLTADDPQYRVVIAPDAGTRTLSIADNGIGMNREDLVANLGTIARSGTAAFLQEATGDAAKDLSLIGQFGVGFYAAFMVADRIEVFSRRAGESEGWRWVSEGQGEFTVAKAEDVARGTRILLHLRADADEFLDPLRLKTVIARYSDHIALPILLKAADGKEEKLNEAAAIWMRPKSEITQRQYAEFYRHVSHGFDEPRLTIHWRAEGKIDYTALIFVPGARPMDIFHPERKHRLKLYVRRVFITDDCADILPGYLRFLQGIVDSEDLPLNVSREMLQHNPLLAKIRAALVKRSLSELAKLAEKDTETYDSFWNDFGAVLKEGLYEDTEQRETLLKLTRFRSTTATGLTSLADYVGRMKPGQDAIYYITGESVEAAARSPHLEGFAARGVEVLLLADPVDDFWIPAVGSYDGRVLKSVTRGGADLDKIALPEDKQKSADEPQPAGTDALIALLRLALKDAVKDVRASSRLDASAVCLVADEGDMDIRLERLLKQHRQIDEMAKRVLEVNPRHPLIAGLARRLSAKGNADEVTEAAWLLLDQARIVQGEPLADPTAFARRLDAALLRAIA